MTHKIIIQRFALLMAWFALAQCGLSLASADDITPQASVAIALQQQIPIALIDVRTREEFSQGHVPGAINIPYTELDQRIEELDNYRDSEVIVYCQSGRLASLSLQILDTHQFKKTSLLEGHIQGWQAAGLPIEQDINTDDP